MRKACQAGRRSITVRLPPGKILKAAEPKAVKTEEQGPPKRTRAAKAKMASPEVVEVGRPGPSRAVYMNEPPADWESDEMAAAVEAAGEAWVEIGKAQDLEARAKEQEARASRRFGGALKAIAEALNKQNA
jgi:hypothetical protein